MRDNLELYGRLLWWLATRLVMSLATGLVLIPVICLGLVLCLVLSFFPGRPAFIRLVRKIISTVEPGLAPAGRLPGHQPTVDTLGPPPGRPVPPSERSASI